MDNNYTEEKADQIIQYLGLSPNTKRTWKRRGIPKKYFKEKVTIPKPVEENSETKKLRKILGLKEILYTKFRAFSKKHRAIGVLRDNLRFYDSEILTIKDEIIEIRKILREYQKKEKTKESFRVLIDEERISALEIVKDKSIYDKLRYGSMLLQEQEDEINTKIAGLYNIIRI